ncbi:OadG family protein [Zobellella taiwanensis]
MNNVSEQLLEAASLMGLGMAFVFAFLSLAILAITVMSRLAAEAAPAPKVAVPASSAPGLSPQKMAAIGAAIKQYKNNNKY